MKNTGVIFLVEHQKEQILLLDRLFREACLRNPLKIARYGKDAIQYLKGTGLYSDRLTYPLPSIILLDISNPDGSSMALIGWIRDQKPFFDIPIIILAEAEDSVEIQRALDLGANACVLKTQGMPELIQLISSIDSVDLNDSDPIPAVLKAS
ncbi:MAG: response regulator [Verrucomicrobiales bacterium]